MSDLYTVTIDFWMDTREEAEAEFARLMAATSVVASGYLHNFNDEIEGPTP